MKTLFFLLFFFFAVIFQISFSSYLGIYGAYPNFILFLLVFLLTLKEKKQRLFCLLVLGILFDLLTFSQGKVFFGLALSFFLLDYLFQNFFKSLSLFSFLILIFLGILFYNLFFLSFSLIEDFFREGMFAIRISWLFLVLKEAAYNTILASLVYLILNFGKFLKI